MNSLQIAEELLAIKKDIAHAIIKANNSEQFKLVYLLDRLGEMKLSDVVNTPEYRELSMKAALSKKEVDDSLNKIIDLIKRHFHQKM